MNTYAWISLVFTVMLVVVTLTYRYLSRQIKWFRCHTCYKVWNEEGEELPSYIEPFPDAEMAICSACARERIKQMDNYAKRN